MMGIFGWSYPAGAASDPSAPYNQEEAPCMVCGLFSDECVCPECPVCGTHGDEACYVNHGLVRTPEQVAGRARLDEAIAQQAQRDRDEGEYWAHPDRQKEEAELQQYWADCEKHVREQS